MRKLIFSGFRLITLSLILCNTAYAENDIHLTNGWISEAPPTVSVLAAYLDIKNNSDKTIKLLDVSSSDFSHIEIHRSVTKGDLVSMEKQTYLDITAGEIFKLTPGEYHLMLFEPKKALRSGDSTTISFSFNNGNSQDLLFSVKRRGNNDHHHHHH